MGKLQSWFRTQTVKARAARSVRLRPVFAAMLHRLPPLPLRPTDACSAHMLCGAAAFDMGVWASYSLLRFLPELRLFVHSDGTLTPDQAAEWCRLLPGTTVVPMADATARATAAWAGRFDALLRWRNARLLHSKWTDATLVSPCPRTLLLDSDVLCFADPADLRAACRDGGRSLAWNDDVYEAYALKAGPLGELVGFPVPARFNSGCAVLPRLTDDDLAWVDFMLHRLADGGVDLNHHWIEQTLLGVLAGHLGGGPLPPAYTVQWGKTDPGKVLRHYVSARNVRERFVSEGLPRVARSLGMRPRVRAF